MIQRISKRFLSLLLVAVMVLALLPVITLPAFAAGLSIYIEINARNHQRKKVIKK